MVKLMGTLKAKVYLPQGDNHSLSREEFLASENTQKCRTSELELREWYELLINMFSKHIYYVYSTIIKYFEGIREA